MGQRILLLSILLGLFVNILGKESRLKVLSFGGNGNIGSAVLKTMIDSGSYDIVMSTRGSWHWDSEERIGPNVRFVK